ncbi:MAG: glycosyltransferase 87 family protein [Acidimicrobiales bacterium]
MENSRTSLVRRWRTALVVVVAVAGAGEMLWCAVALRHGAPLDLGVYRAAAKNLLAGGSPYTAHFGRAHLPFTYPPFALFWFVALTVLGTVPVAILWWVASVTALLLVCARALASTTTWRAGDRWLVAAALAGTSSFVLEPVRNSISFGQINLLLMVLITTDVLSGPSRWRGLRVGVASALKLTPLAYVPGFALARDRRAALRALAVFLGGTALAWALWPAGSSTFWRSQAFSPGHKGGAFGAANQSEFGLIHRVLGVGPPATVVWLAASAVTVAGGYWCARRYFHAGRSLDALVALALTEVLVSPVSWTHHWSWVVLMPVLGAARWRSDRLLSLGCAAVTLVAVAMPYHWHAWRWYGHGPWRALPGFSLTLVGAMLLGVMVAGAWRERRARARAVTGATRTVRAASGTHA